MIKSKNIWIIITLIIICIIICGLIINYFLNKNGTPLITNKTSPPTTSSPPMSKNYMEMSMNIFAGLNNNGQNVARNMDITEDNQYITYPPGITPNSILTKEEMLDRCLKALKVAIPSELYPDCKIYNVDCIGTKLIFKELNITQEDQSITLTDIKSIYEDPVLCERLGVVILFGKIREFIINQGGNISVENNIISFSSDSNPLMTWNKQTKKLQLFNMLLGNCKIPLLKFQDMISRITPDSSNEFSFMMAIWNYLKDINIENELTPQEFCRICLLIYDRTRNLCNIC